MPPLLIKLICEKVVQSPMPFFVKPIARTISAKVQAMTVDPNLKRQWDFMESELTHNKWFAGSEFSAADIQMSFPIEAAAQRAGLDESRVTEVAGFADRKLKIANDPFSAANRRIEILLEVGG